MSELTFAEKLLQPRTSQRGVALEEAIPPGRREEFREAMLKYAATPQALRQPSAAAAELISEEFGVKCGRTRFESTLARLKKEAEAT